MPLDLRTQKLAKIIVDYSLKVKKGENVIISGGVESIDLVSAIYKEVILRGAHPITRLSIPGLNSFFYKYASDEQIENFPKYLDYMVKTSQKYVGIISETNTRELSNADPKKISKRARVLKPITNYIANEKDKIRRCTTCFPCVALAQEAEMDLTEYENFVYSACIQDWKKLSKKMKKVLDFFRKSRKVHLIGEGVDLKFEVRGEKAAGDFGEENMPGGEIFMAPIRESAEGYIKFEYPAIRNSREISGIYLRFKEGKVVEARSDKNENFLKEIISVDENASYIGEFGIGMNPKITKYTKNLLFDEKISGTIHIALGMAYKENGGGNDSAIHFDIVKDMKKGKIIVDGKVIQERGVWKI